MLVTEHKDVKKPALDALSTGHLKPVDAVLLTADGIHKILCHRSAGRSGFDAGHAQRGPAAATKSQPVHILIAVFDIPLIERCRIEADGVGGIHLIIAVLIKNIDGHLLAQMIDAQLA